MLFVIEHLEPRLSKWLFLEYFHAAKIVGKDKLIITNIKNRNERLSRIARVEQKRASELFKQKELIVLDPSARKNLSPGDMQDKKAIVIGGILGADPPLGRTRKLLTKYLPKTSKRNIGKHQFSIDGATYMAKQISDGKTLGEVHVQVGVEIQINEKHSVILPYAYPLVNGKPLISKELISYLKRPWSLRTQ